jgi:hypothetical protein
MGKLLTKKATIKKLKQIPTPIDIKITKRKHKKYEKRH